ncbi:diguanylate cyclase [Clostridium sp. CS001]|uniref:diguanylate cyclase domain-containing protein n=1 Tax=Clostridium sp. CS001 TaxID=2880648 RepID=UPI001CF4DAF0|nr:diguanylate cyclase [Clostridium sp. CS001]MCB2290810.1 diguanylate cyclase [Clostridium sp. CS001]
MRIKHQLLLTHGLLVILSLVIVLINVIAYKGMDSDASLINRSGKLRALSYNMTQLSNQINNHDYASNNTSLSSLQERINEFDSTLVMLSDKKNHSSMDLNYNLAVERFQGVADKWDKVFKPSYLKILENKSSDELCTQINNEIDSYVNDINEMVTSYSVYAKGKIIKALAVNGALVFFIILVALYSFTSTNRRIQRPMKALMHELKELSLIDDDLPKQLKSINTDELSEMSQYFNEMMYDQLTKTFNRRSGLAKLSKMLQYDNRRRLEMSLCFIDVNGLKMVNDQLGHKFGDELIVSAIDCIKQEIRNDDFIIRMGGDEFLIVFKGINEEVSEKVWDRINNRYQVINENEDRAYIISVSHGIVEYDNFEKSEVELLIKNADDKMYLEKRHIKEELKIKIIK